MTEQQILSVYETEQTMFKAAKKLGVSIDEVRRVVIKNGVGHLNKWDSSYLKHYERQCLTPSGKRR